MLQKINASALLGHGPIKVFYPGMAMGDKEDSGLASIGRIDHAVFEGNNVIAMHPHVNDEILTYLRSGHVEHIDSEGYKKDLNNTRLMLMNAGRAFSHEEKIIDKGEPLEGLQLFIRPKTKDLKPAVTFLDLQNTFSLNQWRLIASPEEKTTLQFSSQTYIYDVRADTDTTLQLPKLPNENLTCLLYVFNGAATVNDDISLLKKDSVLIKNEAVHIKTNETTDLVLFVTNEDAEYFDGGMFSGNKL